MIDSNKNWSNQDLKTCMIQYTGYIEYYDDEDLELEKENSLIFTGLSNKPVPENTGDHKKDSKKIQTSSSRATETLGMTDDFNEEDHNQFVLVPPSERKCCHIL